MQQLVSWLRQGSLSCNDQRSCEIALRSIQLLSHCSDNSLNLLEVLSILPLPWETKINVKSFLAISHSIRFLHLKQKRPHHLCTQYKWIVHVWCVMNLQKRIKVRRLLCIDDMRFSDNLNLLYQRWAQRWTRRGGSKHYGLSWNLVS